MERLVPVNIRNETREIIKKKKGTLSYDEYFCKVLKIRLTEGRVA